MYTTLLKMHYCSLKKPNYFGMSLKEELGTYICPISMRNNTDDTRRLLYEIIGFEEVEKFGYQKN